MRVRVTDDAASDLRSIASFFASRSVVVGERILEQVCGVIGSLRTFPHLGYPGIVQGTLERTAPRTPYVIVYRVDVGNDNELIILRSTTPAQGRSRGHV